MKKFIVPMILGVLTVGGLTSCNINPTENINHNAQIINVRRNASDTTASVVRTITSVGEYDLDKVLPTTSTKLGLSVKEVTIPTYEEDFSGQTSFDFMGFKYTATTTDSTTSLERTGAADNASTVTEVFAGTISAEGGSTNTFADYSQFTNATTLYGATEVGTNIAGMTKLNTIVFGTSAIITEELGSNIKFVVLSSDTEELKGLELLHTNTKVICPASIAPNIKRQINRSFVTNIGEFDDIPTLYVVPDSEIPYQEARSAVYEIGGSYISKSQSDKYMVSLLGDRLTKASMDLALLEDEVDIVYAASPIEEIEKHHLEELYYTFLNYESTAAFRYITADKLYLGNTTSVFWGTYYTGFDEIYFPDVEVGFETLTMNASSYEGNSFFYPESAKENDVYDNLITELEEMDAVVDYYDPSTYKPVMEVEVNGVRKSTTDMTVSYQELVEEAYDEYEELNNETDDKDDDLTEEEQEKLEQDHEAADPVQDSITSLTNITLDSKDVIIEAKEAFEALTYDQQQLVENVDDLEDAIKEYNELVEEYNEDVEDEDDMLEPIEKLHIKNKVEGFFEDIKENKAMTAVTVIAGSALSGLLVYGIFKLISKFVKWLKR